MASHHDDGDEVAEHLELSETNLLATLSDPARRSRLLTAMRAERGGRLPLTNRYEALATRTQIDPESLRRLTDALIEAQQLDLLSPLVFNPAMPDDVLLRLCREGHRIDSLGHRHLPRAILETLVELHEYPEAVLSLALDLYADPDVTTEQLTAFLTRRAAHDWMLRALAGGTPSHPEKERAYWRALEANPESAAVRTVLVALLEDPARSTDDFAEVLHAHAGEAWTLEALLMASASRPDKEALVHEACERHPGRERLRDIARHAEAIHRATSAELSADEAEALAATELPEILLGLAGNPHTPARLLRALRETRGTPKARAIRRRAQETLATRPAQKAK